MTNGCPELTLLPNIKPGGPRGRRPGHPRHRALARTDDLPKGCAAGAVAACDRDLHAYLRCRAVTLAVVQALPSFASEARWPRYARKSMQGLFPYLPVGCQKSASGCDLRIRERSGPRA